MVQVILYLVVEVLVIIINPLNKCLSVNYVSCTGETTVNKTDKNDHLYDIDVLVTQCSGTIVNIDILGDD